MSRKIKKTKRNKHPKRHYYSEQLRESNRHHVIPQSRLKDNNTKTILIPKTFHDAWHRVFGNLYGQEILEFISEFQKITREKDVINEADIINLWNKVKSLNLNATQHIENMERKEVEPLWQRN